MNLTHETKAKFKTFADDRARDQFRVADAAIEALKLLPRDAQDALIEGRPVEHAAAN